MSERSCISITQITGVFFSQSFHANGTKLYSVSNLFKGSWIEFATDINSVMYIYRQKEVTRTPFYDNERDKDILEIFDLA